MVAFASDDDDDDLDLVDTDAQSLLLVCVEEMEPADARDHLSAWCAACPATRPPPSCARRWSTTTTPTSGNSASRPWT